MPVELYNDINQTPGNRSYLCWTGTVDARDSFNLKINKMSKPGRTRIFPKPLLRAIEKQAIKMQASQSV
jgi:hypothetical protein